MVNINTFAQLALSFEGAVEEAHFEKRSFRVGKRIFATLDEKNFKAVLKLSLLDQSTFCSFDLAVIYPVSGKWGTQGWTVVELKKVRKDLLHDALACAFCNVAPKRLSEKYKVS